jgi:hypothetical protein
MINQESAPAFSILSILSSIIGWATLSESQYVFSFIATIVGIVSGIFAIRYYYLAGNKFSKDEKQS